MAKFVNVSEAMSTMQIRNECFEAMLRLADTMGGVKAYQVTFGSRGAQLDILLNNGKYIECARDQRVNGEDGSYDYFRGNKTILTDSFCGQDKAALHVRFSMNGKFARIAGGQGRPAPWNNRWVLFDIQDKILR